MSADQAVSAAASARRIVDLRILLLGLGTANVLTLLCTAGTVTAALYLKHDIASAPVISTLIGNAPAGRIVRLGDYPWYEPLWWMELTRSLPAHRQLWEVTPFVGSAFTIALIVWAARRAIGAWPALLTGVLLCCTTTATRYVLLTPNAHGIAVLHAALLLAVLVYLNGRREWLSTRSLVAIGATLAVVTAPGATDRLFLVTGLAPFVLATWLGWWRTRHRVQGRIALLATSVAAVAAGGGALLDALMRHDNVVQTPTYQLGFVAAGGVGGNLEHLVDGFAYLGGGDFFGRPIAAAVLPAFTAGLLTLAAAAFVLHRCWRAAPKLLNRCARVTPTRAARDAYLLFWGLTIPCVVLPFVFTSAAQGVFSGRYAISAYLAVAALLPALGGTSRPGRAVLAGTVAVFAVIALQAGIRAGRYDYGHRLPAADIQAVEDYARANHLTYGYADYDTAPALTWATQMHVQVFPVMPCGARLCPFYLHTISSWYVPRAHTRTFLIIDAASQSKSTGIQPVSGPVAAFGQPTARLQFGVFTLYIYDHDIAKELGPA